MMSTSWLGVVTRPGPRADSDVDSTSEGGQKELSDYLVGRSSPGRRQSFTHGVMDQQLGPAVP